MTSQGMQVATEKIFPSHPAQVKNYACTSLVKPRMLGMIPNMTKTPVRWIRKNKAHASDCNVD